MQITLESLRRGNLNKNFVYDFSNFNSFQDYCMDFTLNLNFFFRPLGSCSFIAESIYKEDRITEKVNFFDKIFDDRLKFESH